MARPGLHPSSLRRACVAATAIDPAEARAEWLRCSLDVAYFTLRYVHIYNATAQAWLPFDLWPAQVAALRTIAAERLLVILKARQLGLSWLALAYALWLMLVQAPSTVLLFSLREAEAVELLARLRGIYARLPGWLQARRQVEASATRWQLSNGSHAIALSTRGGRSYTATLALVDEADYVPDLGHFLSGVKPTVDAGGKLLLISTSDKRQPVSAFKRLFRAAQAETGDYRALFLPWSARPDRDAAWYAATKAEMAAQQGSDDAFLAEYPATPEEALAPAQQDRRLPLAWLQGVYTEGEAIRAADQLGACAGVAGLTVYSPPTAGRRYVVGVDPAEGNPNSDDSAACVLDAATWSQVATLVGKLEPGRMAQVVAQVAEWYNRADVLVERNNHGHAVIRALQADGTLRLLDGYDGRPGWLSNVKGKPLLYDLAAQAVREGACRIVCPATLAQLASIEAVSLRAPAGLNDDRADAFALALAAVAYHPANGAASSVAPAADPLALMDGSSTW